MKKKFSSFYKRTVSLLKNQNGFGIKEIAVSLGAIVVIGLIITAFRGQVGDILEDIWEMVKGYIGEEIQ
ncbi:MAG: hypothetical protein ACOYWZ_17305 [Bacillota bacterium]